MASEVARETMELESPVGVGRSHAQAFDEFAAVKSWTRDRIHSLPRPGHTDLLVAVMDNDVVTVKRLLSLDRPLVDVNKKDGLDRTPLHLACWKGYKHLVKELLECEGKDLKVNAPAKGGIVPLHLAAYFGHNDIVNMLIEHPDIQLNAKTVKEKFTVAHFCVSGGHVTTFKMYLRKCFRQLWEISIEDVQQYVLNIINAEDATGRTPLHYAAWDNRIEVVRLLMEFGLIEVNARDRDGFTPLHLASYQGHQEIVSLLLEKEDIDFDVKTFRSNEQTQKLFIPTLQHDIEWDKLPRPKLADYYTRFLETRPRLTPLQYAVEKNHWQIASVLIDRISEKLGSRGLEGQLHLQATDIDQIGTLLKALAFVNKERREERGLESVIEVLLKRLQGMLLKEMQDDREWSAGKWWADCNPDKLPFDENFLICQLAFQGSHEMLRVVLHNVPFMSEFLNAGDGQNLPPLHIAIETDHLPVVRVLLGQENLKVNEVDKRGRVALQVAILKNRKDAEKLLMKVPEVKNYVERLYKDRQVYVDAANTTLVGAALIASVTFAGWLQPPLGYTSYYEFAVPDAPDGTYESYASVKQHISTRIFWVFNSLSFFFAVATVLAGAGTVLPSYKPNKFIGDEVRAVRRNLITTYFLFLCSIVFVLGAFGAAGLAVLPPIFHLEVNMIITCIIGSIPCVVILFYFGKKDPKLNKETCSSKHE